jgi:DUF2975 family protein
MQFTQNEKMKTPISINIIYWLVTATFWLLIFAFGWVVIETLSAWGLVNFDSLSISLPADKNLLSLSSILVNGKETPVSISEVMVKILYANLEKRFLVIHNSILLLATGLLIYAFYNIKRFLHKVKQNIVFNLVNVRFLKYTAYGFFGVGVLADLVLSTYVKWYFNSSSHFTVDFIGLLLNNFFVAGIAVLALAYIFEQGVRLQNEQNLTI